MQALQPIHVQLENLIRDKIAHGEFPIGTPLPSERRMAETYGISRLTVRTALQNLQKEGLILAQHGKGYFVQNSKIRINFSGLRGFGAQLKEQGVTHTSKVLFAKKMRSGYELSKAFSVPRGTPLFHLTRVRLANGHPVMVDDTYLLYDLIPDVEQYDFAVTSFYSVLDRNGIQLEHAQQFLSVYTLYGECAHVLELPDATPVFRINHRVYDHAGRLADYTFSYVNPHRANITTYLRNPYTAAETSSFILNRREL